MKISNPKFQKWRIMLDCSFCRQMSKMISKVPVNRPSDRRAADKLRIERQKIFRPKTTEKWLFRAPNRPGSAIFAKIHNLLDYGLPDLDSNFRNCFILPCKSELALDLISAVYCLIFSGISPWDTGVW